MLFQLDTANDDYTDKDTAKYEQLGFLFTKHDYPDGHWLDGKPYCWQLTNSPLQIEIDNLDKLMSLCREMGEDLVIGFTQGEDIPRLTIYDGYLE